MCIQFDMIVHEVITTLSSWPFNPFGLHCSEKWRPSSKIIGVFLSFVLVPCFEFLVSSGSDVKNRLPNISSLRHPTSLTLYITFSFQVYNKMTSALQQKLSLEDKVQWIVVILLYPAPTAVKENEKKERKEELWLAWAGWKERFFSLFLTLCTPTSVCIFSTLISKHFPWYLQGEFFYQSRAFWVCDHFTYSHDLNVWFRGDNVWRN